jgi:hypothetical protein
MPAGKTNSRIVQIRPPDGGTGVLVIDWQSKLSDAQARLQSLFFDQ